MSNIIEVASCEIWNGMELWNGMEYVFGMEYRMEILSYAFDVRVISAISWDERGHSNDDTYVHVYF